MALKIITNNHWRDFAYRSDVPEKVLRSQFDWTDKDHEEDGSYSDGFICYRSTWYHLADFGRVAHGDGSPFNGWNGYHGDSFFSGVVIKLSDDGEQYQIGTYIHTSEVA